MSTTRIPQLFRTLVRAPRQQRTERRAVVFRLRLEALEGRVVPATATWDGGGAINHWTDRLNWVNDVLPVAGDELVFPLGAARLSNVNDFPSGTSFGSLTFSGSDYNVSASSNLLNLDVGGIT